MFEHPLGEMSLNPFMWQIKNWRFGWRTALAVILAAGAGCDVQRREADEHGHEHESSATRITVWGDHHEIFIEHRPPIAGQPTTFATHVTDLRTFQPRADGLLGFRIQQAGHPPSTLIEPHPARPGVYLASLTFPTAGDWQVSVLVPDLEADAILDLPSVRVHADAHAAAHAEKPPTATGIDLLKEQQWMLGLETGLIGTRQLVERMALPAQVRSKPGHQATVVAPVAGQIHPPPGNTLPLLGGRVEPGQVVALLRPVFSEAAVRLMELEAETTRAQAIRAQAEAALERVERLAAEQARSPREVEEAALSLAVAKANHEAAAALQSTYRLAGPSSQGPMLGVMPEMELRAPIGGILDSLTAGLGEPVEAGQKVFTLLDPNVVWIEARVPEAHLARLTDTKAASYELPGARNHFTDLTQAGAQPVFTGLRVDPSTRSVPLVYEVPNPDGILRVGQSLTLHVETARVVEAPAVPQSAIVQEGGQPVAFVQMDGETFEKRNLTLGIRDRGWVEVRGGLSKGERVVIRGAFAVRLASVVPALPAHGHAH
jgi:membrane fusion protein, heavy metal efflux system